MLCSVNYIEKHCTQSIEYSVSRRSKQQKLNVINYNHEYYAVAHLNMPTASFKCIIWRMCFMLIYDIYFAVLDRWLIRH